MQASFNEMLEALSQDAISILCHEGEENRLQLVERLCDAGQAVAYPWGKWAVHALAAAVLGGEEALTTLIVHMERWKQEHIERESAERTKRRAANG